MAEAMEGIMGLAGAPEPQAQIDPDLFSPEISNYAQTRPMDFRRDMLGAMEEADPALVAEFKSNIAAMQLPDEVLQALGQLVDYVLENVEEYDAIRTELLADDEDGVFAEILPEQFDPAYFQALNMALDEMAMSKAQEPQAFADGGLATLTPIAKAMADMGRNGDTMLAHITPSEARMLRRYGGSGTINPYTGLPEYFIKKIVKGVKKVVKGVGKAVKGVVKGIGKAVKKVASSKIGRMILTAAAVYFMGPAGLNLAGSVGLSGATALGVNTFAASTLVGVASGQKLGDALKTGAISGLTAGVGASVFPSMLPKGYAPTTPDLAGAAAPGVTADVTAGTPVPELPTAAPPTGAVTSPVDIGGGSIREYSLTTQSEPYFPPNAGQSLLRPAAPGGYMPGASSPMSAAGTSLGGGITATEQFAAMPPMTQQYAAATQQLAQGVPTSPTAQAVQDIAARTSMAPTTTTLPSGITVESANAPINTFQPGDVSPPVPGSTQVAGQSWWDKTKNFFSPEAREAAGKAGQLDAYNKTLLETGGKVAADGTIVGGNVELATQAYKDAAVGIVGKYGPLALAGVGTLAAMGGLSPQPAEMPEMFKGPTGSELLERYPEKYSLAFGGSRVVRAPQYRMPGYADGGIATLADGGTAKFPRKNGHISGPGGPKDDKIPAMLSDGEFVFTAKAVRNMGNGSRRKGAKKMYALMKALEGRAA